jgi:hypothetical protein
MKYHLNHQYKHSVSPTSLVMVYVSDPFFYSFSPTTIYLSIRPTYKSEGSVRATCLVEDIKSLRTEFFTANTDNKQKETLSFVTATLLF